LWSTFFRTTALNTTHSGPAMSGWIAFEACAMLKIGLRADQPHL
jgi:hypothetical protein